VDLGPGFDGLVDAQIAIMGAEAAVALRVELEQRPAELSQRLREFLDAGRSVSADRLRGARQQAERCRRELDAIFADLDAIITPAAAGEAPQGLDATGDPVFCRIWTLLGTPSLSLPLLQGPAGLPIGVQLVGARGRDHALLAAAMFAMR
jgi:Asp-tRNA(Asn)/Glu-tRNA(Gln) amidotransferase A subunit family amidase